MTKFWVAIFSALVLPLSIYASGNQSYYLNLFVETDIAFTFVRIILAITLLSYAFLPAIRNAFSKELLGGLGLVLLGLSAVSMVSPTLFGYFSDYSAIGETFIFFEAGILARLLSHELPINQTRAINFIPLLKPFQQKVLSSELAKTR